MRAVTLHYHWCQDFEASQHRHPGRRGLEAPPTDRFAPAKLLQIACREDEAEWVEFNASLDAARGQACGRMRRQSE
jgi:hypothetical protein